MYDAVVRWLNATTAKIILIALGAIWTAFVAILPYLLIALALLAIHIFIAKMMERTAKMKGHKKSHAFALCFWFGIFGYIHVMCLPDLKLQQLQDISCAILANPDDPDAPTLEIISNQ